MHPDLGVECTAADHIQGSFSCSKRSDEVGVPFNSGPFGLLANVQSGKGIGILSDGDQGDIKGLNWLLQGTYKLTDKLKFGLNYGISKNRDSSLNNTLAFKSNENGTMGLYCKFNSSAQATPSSYLISGAPARDFGR